MTVSLRLPTRPNDWRLAARTARLVLSIPVYLGIAALAGFVGLSLFVLTQNLAIVGDVVLGGSLPLDARLSVLVGLYPVVGSVFGPASSALLLLVAALVGIDIAMLAYHVREHGLSVRQGGSGTVGVILGTLGAGCAACGSAVLVGVLSLLGVTGAATLLPLDGLEFALLALVALLLSVFWIADGMRGGEINGCPVDLPGS